MDALMIAKCRSHYYLQYIVECKTSRRCDQHFKLWTETGLFQQAWRGPLKMKKSMKQFNLDTILGDGTFVSAKKRPMSVPERLVKASKARLLDSAAETLIGVLVTNSSPRKLNLVEALLE